MGLSGSVKERLRSLLMERKVLLNSMLLCTPAKIDRMREDE